MKNTSKSADNVDRFIGRSLARARKLDRGERLPSEIRITFEDPADLVRALSVGRIKMLRMIRLKPTPMSDLASVLKRDRAAVRRDVQVLKALGLVNVREESNPGHGRRRIVEPLAKRYQLTATI